MSYILNDFSLLTHGLVAPVDGDDFCLGEFPLLSHGLIIPEPVDAGAGLADPYTGPSRFNEPKPPGWEPFDLSYFRTKYARQPVQPSPTQSTPPQGLEPEVVQRDIGRLEEILATIAAREAEQQLAALEAARLLEQKERADALAAELAALELAEEAQRALLAELEQNRIDARDTLLAALALQRRQRQNMAAIAATMQYFY